MIHSISSRFLTLLFIALFVWKTQAQAPIAQVETAIPAFIGHTEKAEKGWLSPVKITSLDDYAKIFGGAQPEPNLHIAIKENQDAAGRTTDLQVSAQFTGPRSKHLMYYSLESYFANGGGPCYVVPVGGYLEAGKDLTPGDARRQTVFYGALAAVEKIDEVTLIVFPEIQGMARIADMRALYDAALAQCAKTGDRFLIMDLYRHDAQSDIPAIVKKFRSEGVGAQNLQWGAAYGPNIETSHAYAFDSSIPVDYEVIAPGGGRINKIALSDLAAKFPNAYRSVQAELNTIPCILPVAPAVAGIYVATDRANGVWKAPANVSINQVLQPVKNVTQAQQEQMNVDPATGKSVNAIRAMSGKGTLVWGARTLAGNDNEWRYVPVRRFASMVEESIKKGTQFVVFEPNDEPLWAQVRLLVGNFMNELWRKGALQGSKPDQAYFVRTGLGYTMTAQDILDGKIIIEVGFAPLKPAEFVVVRITHRVQ